MLKNVLIFIVYMALVALAVFLLYSGKLTSGYFVLFVIAVSLLSLGLYGFDRLREIDLRNLRLVLNEIRETKKEIFAKVEEVRSLMVDLADSYIYSAFHTGRFAGEEGSILETMVKERDIARLLLEKAELDKDAIDSKIDPIDQLIDRHLLFDIEEKAVDFVRRRDKKDGFHHLLPRKFGERDQDFIGTVNSASSDAEIVSRIKEYLSQKAIPQDFLESELSTLAYFLEYRCLPSRKNYGVSQ